jgi:hypothetical protein
MTLGRLVLFLVPSRTLRETAVDGIDYKFVREFGRVPARLESLPRPVVCLYPSEGPIGGVDFIEHPSFGDGGKFTVSTERSFGSPIPALSPIREYDVMVTVTVG